MIMEFSLVTVQEILMNPPGFTYTKQQLLLLFEVVLKSESVSNRVLFTYRKKLQLKITPLVTLPHKPLQRCGETTALSVCLCLYQCAEKSQRAR